MKQQKKEKKSHIDSKHHHITDGRSTKKKSVISP